MSEGNWRSLTREYDDAIGSKYTDPDGYLYDFIGLLHAEDDFYFVLISLSDTDEAAPIFLSCVCSLELYGYEKVE